MWHEFALSMAPSMAPRLERDPPHLKVPQLYSSINPDPDCNISPNTKPNPIQYEPTLVLT